jgi:neuronal growth regulator 1
MFFSISQVIWTDKSQQTLAMGEKRIVEDQRISVFRPFLREWNLQIRDITYEDRGEYRCTINTSPVKSKIVILRVKGKLTYFYILSGVHLKVIMTNQLN